MRLARWLDGPLFVAALLVSPFVLTRWALTGKLRTDWRGRFGRADVGPPGDRLRVVVHAVSVGEVNAARHLVEALSGSDVEVVLATTTDTGFARAASVAPTGVQVVRYPFDFACAVDAFLNRVQPAALVLMELELWPNMAAACARRDIPVLVVNGRLSERSARRYARMRGLVRRLFGRPVVVAAQDETYAARFRDLGASNVVVTGTMKWDTASIADAVAGADELAEAIGLDPARPLVVAGSTAPEEHTLLDEAVTRCGEDVQLLCAPRRPEWFAGAAAALGGAARRTEGRAAPGTSRFVLDTIGELRMAYALADVVVVGRSFGDRWGSDMMEPVALGKATVIGPAYADFQSTGDALREADGLVVVDGPGLGDALAQLLGDADRRTALAENGREVIRHEQGATLRNAILVHQALGRPYVLHSQSAQETMNAARQLAALVAPGDVVALSGELGAGKTCFARGLATGFGVAARDVSSPSFVIAQEYTTHQRDGMPIVHADGYRLQSPDELESIGWDDMQARARAVVVEWPDRFGDALPRDHWQIMIRHIDETERELTITPPMRGGAHG